MAAYKGTSSNQIAQGARTRQLGSNFTAFIWQGSIIGFAEQISSVSPTPVGAGATPIQPMDSPYPVEIITPAAQNVGTLTLQLIELYNQKVWEQLAGLAGSPNLVNIFIRMASFGLDANGGGIKLAKIVRPPLLSGQDPSNPNLATIARGATNAAGQSAQYGELYHNVTITNVEDGETIDIGAMQVSKRITVAYTNMTIFGTTNNTYTDIATTLSQRSLIAIPG